MGVDIQTYRARIGAYTHSKAGNISRGDATVNLSTGMKAVGCLVFIGVLLVMAGIEPNPGPKGKDEVSCQSDEVDEVVQDTEANVQDTQHNSGSDHIPLVQISGFSEQFNVNKEMLELFFQNEETNGGGKIKSIDIWSSYHKKYATITFEDRTAVDAFIKNKPTTIFGMAVSIKIIESTRIRITGLLANITEEMLEMFFIREEKQGGGKVKSIYIDRRKNCVLVEFEEEKGVQWIMKTTPMSILGMKVEIEVVGSDFEEVKMIKLTKLPIDMNDEMIRIFFENNADYDGKVVDVSVNSEGQFAIVEFAESAVVYKVANKGTLTICGFKVDVDIFDDIELLGPINVPLIKISGFTSSMNKETLGMFFENEERKGGGKVKHIEFDGKNKCATISFEEKLAVDAFMKTKPKSILGMEVKIEIIDTASKMSNAKNTKVKISGLMENINEEMLKMFFKNEERQGGGKLKEVNIDNRNKSAVIEFEEQTGVEWIMKKTPLSIFGMSVQIEELGEHIEESKMIVISKLPGNLNDEMIKMFFENEKECGGAKVVDVVVNSEENFAVVEFDDVTAVHRVLDKVPLNMFGFEVDVDVHDESRNRESTIDTSIRISGSMENMNKDMLEMFFEVEERNGGGKVKSIDIDYRNNCTIVTFIDKTGVKRIMENPPLTILGIDVEIQEIGASRTPEPRMIKIKKIPSFMNKTMLTTFFEQAKDQYGQVDGITVNSDEHYAIVTFEDSAAVNRVLDGRPLTIFDVEVDVGIVGDSTEGTRRIIITKLPSFMNQTMLTTFFEHAKDQYGKVDGITVNSAEHYAIVTFEDSAAVNRVLDARPLIIFDIEVDVDIFDFEEKPGHSLAKEIPETESEQNLAQTLENERRQSDGNVKNANIDKSNNRGMAGFENVGGMPHLSEERPTKLIVKGIPETISEETLILIFENKRRQGGGRVINVKIDKTNNCGIVEFENSEAVQNVLKKQPIHIEGNEVQVCVFGGELQGQTWQFDNSGNDKNNAQQSKPKETPGVPHLSGERPTKLIVKGIPETISEEILILIFENERRQGGGRVNNVKIDKSNNCGIVEFENSEAVQIVLNKQPIHIEGNKVQVCAFGGDLQGQSWRFDTSGNDKKDSQQSEQKETPDILDSDSKTFHQMLQRLELLDKYPGKISIKDIVTVDPNEWNEHERVVINLSDIPRLVLKRLICSHSESRDVTVTDENSSSDNFELDNTLSFISDIPDKEDISPLDVFHIIFQCCDPFLKQVIVQKLYLCKLAVPFLYMKLETDEKRLSMLSIWPLRSLAIENNQISDCKAKVKSKEIDVIELPTNMIAFGRLGRPRYSKSKLINSLLTSQGCNTFFNIDCPSGMTLRKLSNGQIEMFWLPTTGEKKDRFQEAMTFLNLRGDIGVNFGSEIISFIADFADAITLIVDKESILNHGKYVKNVLLNFSSVVLIIANPLNSETFKAIKCFQDDVLSCKQEMKLRVLSTHKGGVEQNVVDMVSTITKHISNQLKSNCTKSYKERYAHAKVASIKTDEEDKDCIKGKRESIKMIDHMKSSCRSSGWKLHLTPVHSKYSKTLGKLKKEREREKTFSSSNTFDAKIKEVRVNQTQAITETVKLFLKILTKLEKSPISLKYFLSWLHIDIEKEKRLILPPLMQENRQAWQKLKVLKSNETQVQSYIEQENIISKLEEKIDEASFSVEHFFREIGHINDAILELETDCSAFGLPPLSQISNIVSHLVVDGYQFELIDGESFYMPYKWIHAVVEQVNKCISFGKVLTLSVLGLQSSGKSTFLNTMFGCQFSTRTGRCTRGIHVQLVPAYTDAFNNKSSDYDYILVVDTEGLRSPELSHIQHEHDDELATVITGIGDITILNIMGENTSEIRDILQVIVHAFLRLKITNKKLDMRKSCSFIHQNVADTSASDNMMSGLSKTIQSLDEMTKESASSEGITNITTFNQVIEFDINSQVWYVKNLWQGNPPMAKVNTEYSEKVVEIKSSIMQKALTMKDKSYKSLDDITEQAHNLWKGVLTEDFVFSFRNSIEIKAYVAMEHAVQDELWRLESFIRDQLIHVSQNGFINCNQKQNLSSLANSLTSDLNDKLLNERQKRENVITKYFENDKYKDIIIQWKANQERRFEYLCEKLEKTIRDQIEKSLEKRSVEILTDNCHKEHEEELRISSVNAATKYKDQKLSDKDIDRLFDEIWSSFVNKISKPFSSSEKGRRKMSEIFHTFLKNVFKENYAVLKDVLDQSKNLTPLQNLTNLSGTFNLTGIDDNDINFTWFQKGKKFVSGNKHVMKYVENRVNQVFEIIDEKIKGHCQVREEITEMYVNQMIHELGSSINDIVKGDSEYKFQKPFYVKIFVHVSRHAQAIFEKHNENYFKSYGAAARLERYRVQQKISFEAHLKCRLSEDVVSKIFTNIIESFAEEWIIQTISNEVFVELHSKLPSVKNRVIVEICTDLLDKDISVRISRTAKGYMEKIIPLQKENFDNFRRYIHAPKEYVSSWLTRKALDHLFAPKSRSYTNISKRMIRKVFSVATSCVMKLCDENDKKSPIPIKKWTESFRTLMKESEFSISAESLRSVDKATDVIQNIEYLTKEILDSLKKSEEKLTARFSKTSSENVQWANSNPIDSVVQKIWGCQEQCAFCGEPCTKNENHGGSDHFSLQHRPLCCIGIRYKLSKKKQS